MANVTGWNELTQGQIIQASYVMYNTAWGGYFMAVLFVVFSIALYARTRSAATVSILQIAFLGMFYYYMGPGGGLSICVLMTTFFLAFWLYENLRKN
jgi:hypothetical protein